jgi:flagellin-like protein
MKGISPIIASVLLIAITMSIAVILAAYVTNYTRTATQSIPTTCIGGALFAAGATTCDTVTDTLSVPLEANYVTLSGFKVDTRDSNGILQDTSVTMSPEDTPLPPSATGIYTASVVDCSKVAQIRVTTGNCFNVVLDWTAV